MKNNRVLFMIITFIIGLGLPSLVCAAGTYSVEMVTNSSNNKVIGTYNTYNEALTVMNNQSSNSSSVASIYKNGKIINSKYALFQLKVKSSSATINLYQNSGDSTSYTYTAPYYMSDAALIGSNESRVNIMYNGFRGWANIDDGNIIPISLLGGKAITITAEGLRLRSSYSTSSDIVTSITCSNQLFSYSETHKDGSYMWYKISYNGKTGWVRSGEWLSETTMATINTYYYRYSTGNLLHRYTKHNGTSYVDDYTNLGPTPTYLSEGVHYYSFDGGVYLYTSYLTMIDDYKNNSYNHSINSNEPNYPYYLYLPGKSVSKVTASELDSQITNKSSKLYGQGIYFKEAESLYGMNALSAFATAKNESASGTSQIALDKNNVFGYGASDSCPYACAKSYASVRDSIMDYAKNGLGSYMTAGNKYYFGSHAGTKGSGRNVMYASDALWGEKQAWNAFMADKKINMRDYKSNTLAISKYGKYNLPVYKEANSNTVIYYMRNSNTNHKVYNVPVNVIEIVGDYYKIYADSNSYQYGYVKISDFNITNSAPVITAVDKEIKLGDSFDYKNGVSASDKENGNLTSKITYTGSVNTNKAGVYKVTYVVTDNSNLTVSKSINVTVKSGESVPVITATNKEVSQYTTFDYMEGVTASDSVDGDLTGSVMYEQTVDTSKIGEYKVTYSVTNSKGKFVSKEVIIKVIENAKPVIQASDKTISLNKEFDPLSGVSASDKEDGDLTSSIKVTSNNVDTSIEGEYSVSYEVVDSVLQKVEKTIKINVKVKNIEKVKGRFYLDSLIKSNGNLVIKGYNTIDGIDNNLSTDISYELVLKNQNNDDVVIQSLDRILDKTKIPMKVISNDNKDYTYSWFESVIDVNKIPVGDYTACVRSTSEDYMTENVVQNILLNDQVSQFNTTNKYIIISNNYMRGDIPIEFIVRDSQSFKKETSFDTNQYSYLEDIYFENNKIHLRGASYSVNVDMRENASISRKIIFENIETFEKYTFNLGYITKGSFVIKLISADKFGNTKPLAWYDNSFDISSLKKGKYAIYITNESNVSDYGELSDIMFTDLSRAKSNIDGKEFKFTLNEKLRNRIELTVN